jgi:hypothetical protein
MRVLRCDMCGVIVKNKVPILFLNGKGYSFELIETDESGEKLKETWGMPVYDLCMVCFIKHVEILNNFLQNLNK